MAGRSSVAMKARELGIELDEKGAEIKSLIEHLKELEFQGYEFEAADASLKLLIARVLGKLPTFFEIENYRVMVERHDGEIFAEATVKVKVNGKSEHTVAECTGPVGALDKALRLALEGAYPALNAMELRDYKVRILESGLGANSRTRVLIESSDGEALWGTVGVSDNIIEASWEALQDAVNYKLLQLGV
jgi:2-isopropylmalate synthase